MITHTDKLCNSLVYLAMMRTSEPWAAREAVVECAQRMRGGMIGILNGIPPLAAIRNAGGSPQLVDDVRTILETPRPQPSMTFAIDPYLLAASRDDFEDAVRVAVAALTQSAPQIRAAFADVARFVAGIDAGVETQWHTHRPSRRYARRSRKRRQRKRRR